MGKASGVSRRRKKNFNYTVNRKRLHKKALYKPKILCKPMRQVWDSKKSYWQNMQDMGLSGNPNKTIQIASPMEIDAEKKHGRGKKETVKKNVVESLEAEIKSVQPKLPHLPTPVIRFCVYMLENYADDYKAMARDPKNHYQETPKQIRNRINKFKGIPQLWNGYLRAKGILTDKPQTEECVIDICDILGQ